MVPKVNPENHDLNTTDITDGIAKTRLADQDGATVNGAIHRYDIFLFRLLKWSYYVYKFEYSGKKNFSYEVKRKQNKS